MGLQPRSLPEPLKPHVISQITRAPSVPVPGLWTQAPTWGSANPCGLLATRALGTSLIPMGWLWVGSLMAAGHWKDHVTIRTVEVAAPPPTPQRGRRTRKELIPDSKGASTKPQQHRVRRTAELEGTCTQGRRHPASMGQELPRWGPAQTSHAVFSIRPFLGTLLSCCSPCLSFTTLRTIRVWFRKCLPVFMTICLMAVFLGR